MQSSVSQLPYRNRWSNLAGSGLTVNEGIDELMARLTPGQRDQASAWRKLAWSCIRDGRRDQAETCFRQVLAHDPDSVEAWANLGSFHRARGDSSEAAACFDRAATLEPTNRSLIHAAVAALREARRPDMALVWCERLLRISQTDAEVHWALGNVLQELDRFDEAIKYLELARKQAPRDARIMNSLGIAHHRYGQIQDAVNNFRSALSMQPNELEYRFHLAISLLLMEEYAEGWQQFEFRPGGRFRRHAEEARRLWHGERLSGKRIVLAAEQGLGDTIQAVRFARHIAERFNGEIFLQCPARLVPLLRNVAGLDRTFPREEPLPRFDCFLPLFSAPSLLDYRPASSRTEVPYLRPAPERIRVWDAWLRRTVSDGKRRIGIAWQGDPSFPVDRVRSIPLAEFLPLFELDAVQFISLQFGVGAEQVETFTARDRLVRLPDALDREGAFLDTAALLTLLDGVIISDSAIAHVAGALGVSTWVLLGHVPDWRWHMHRVDCDWYPTFRLFRQSTCGDWCGVVQEVKAALARLCA